jgi:dihydrofolate reductase
MRKLVVSEFLTLDGVMQSPGYPDEDPSGGFEHGGWQMPLMDEVAGAEIMTGMAATDALLLGRVTYEIFAGYWPTAPADDPIADTINAFTKYVVSTTLREPLDWKDSHVIAGDVPEEVGRLKQGSGRDIQVIGSGVLVQTLMQHDLVDEYRLMIYPLILGTGKRLFREGSPKSSLRLSDSKVSGNGVLIATYVPAEH